MRPATQLSCSPTTVRERDLYQAINRLLPRDCFHQSLTGAAMTGNGIPDRFYCSPRGTCWIEFKQLSSMPRSGIVRGALTALQLQWLERRYNNCKSLARPTDVAVVIGLPNRTAVVQTTPTEWREGTHVTTAMSFKEVSSWIDSGLLSRVR